jgi:hypothetical protein
VRETLASFAKIIEKENSGEEENAEQG